MLQSFLFILPVEKVLSEIAVKYVDILRCVRYKVRYIQEISVMNSTTITNFRKNIYGMIERTVRYNEPVNILTREGNAVLISEEEYNNLLETLYMNSVPGMHEKLLDGLNTPLVETVPEDSAVW